MYATTALSYVAYLALVTVVSWKLIYPYSDWYLFSWETLMWISNLGYILYELLEFRTKGAQYFSMDSIINVLDDIICVNWIILFVCRFLASWGFAADLDDGTPYEGEPGIDPTIDRANHPELEDTSAWDRTDPTKRNERYTIFYMTFWSIQVIVLWIRAVGLLQTTEIMGPQLRKMLLVFKDVLSFA